MTHEQRETIERSIAGLSPQDQLESVERLVHELRVPAVAGGPPRSRHCTPSEGDFKQRWLRSGLMTSLPTPGDPASRPAFQRVAIEGESLPEAITRERRRDGGVPLQDDERIPLLSRIARRVNGGA